MGHDWQRYSEIHGNIVVECKRCGYKTSAGYSKNPIMSWFDPGRVMPDLRIGKSAVRPIPECNDYVLESIHD